MRNKIIGAVILALILVTWTPAPAEAADTYYGAAFANALFENVAFADISDHWARDAINRMAALGAIRETGTSFRPEAYASRGDVLGMLIRIADQEGNAQRVNASLAGEKLQNPWGGNYVAWAQRLGIITAAERNGTNWQAAATREEVACWTARALNFAPVYGKAQQAVYNFRDGSSFDREKIPYCEAIIGAKIMTGRTADMFYPLHKVKRGELAAALDKASQLYLPTQGYKYLQGTVLYSSSEGLPGLNTNRRYFQVMQDDGQSFYIVAEPAKDFLVIKNHRLGKSQLLEQGDNIKVLTGPSGEIFLVEALAGLQKVINGTLDYVDATARRLQLTGWDRKAYYMVLSPLCQVNLGGYPSQLYDLVPGQEVSLFVTGSQVAEIKGATNYLAAGALPRDYRTVYGSLFRKSAEELSIRDYNGYPYTFSLTSATRYYVNGYSGSYYDLKIGDSLKLYLDSHDKVLRVDVSRDSGGYKLYRARIYNVRAAFEDIQLNNVYEYQDGYLRSKDLGSLTLDVAGDVQLYANNNKLALVDLAQYRGEEAFLVTAPRQGKEQVLKLVLHGYSERRIEGQVQKINTYLDNLTIKYEPDTVVYDNGTIVLRNDRMVDPDSINDGDEVIAFVEKESSGSVRARVIIVIGRESPEYGIYKGTLERVASRSQLEVDLSYRMRNNEWYADDYSARFSYDSLTKFIYVDRNGIIQRLNDYQFYNHDEDYKNLDIQLITDGDRVLAVLLLDRFGYENQVVTRATVSRRDSNRIVIKKITNWSSYNDRWELQEGEMTLKLDYAVVVENHRGVDPASLAEGDRVYLVRASVAGGNDIYATLILVE